MCEYLADIRRRELRDGPLPPRDLTPARENDRDDALPPRSNGVRDPVCSDHRPSRSKTETLAASRLFSGMLIAAGQVLIGVVVRR